MAGLGAVADTGPAPPSPQQPPWAPHHDFQSNMDIVGPSPQAPPWAPRHDAVISPTEPLASTQTGTFFGARFRGRIPAIALHKAGPTDGECETCLAGGRQRIDQTALASCPRRIVISRLGSAIPQPMALLSCQRPLLGNRSQANDVRAFMDMQAARTSITARR